MQTHGDHHVKRVLVTGATGFLGRHTLPFMTELGYDVHIVSRHSNLNQPKVTAHCCDILDPMKSTQLLDKVRPSHLLHLAWCTEPKTFWNTSDNLRWSSASTHLFSSFVKFGGHRIVGCGSCAEYEWVDGRVCHERSTPTRPASNYGRAKLSTGNWLDTFATANGISAAWPRIFYLFGPWGHEQRMPGCIIDALLDNRPAKCSSGTQARDYIYITDAAIALATLLDSPVEGPVNIATGQPVQILKIAEQTAELLNRRHLLHVGALPDSPVNNPNWLAADVTRLREEVGIIPRVNQNEGLQHTINWWKHARQSRAAS